MMTESRKNNLENCLLRKICISKEQKLEKISKILEKATTVEEPLHVSHDRFTRDLLNRGPQILLNLIYIVKGTVL